MSIFRGINVVSLTVPDLDAARSFYAETLGLGPPVYDFPDAGWVEFGTGAPGGALAIVPCEAAAFAPTTWTTLVLNVESCAKAVAELRARGVRCDEPVGVPGMVTYANFYDPWGNRLQMCSAPPAAAAPEPARP